MAFRKTESMLEPIFIGQAAIGPGENRVVQMPLGSFPSGALVEVPIHVSRSQFSGPTVLLMAGLHGDEINGVEILRRVLESGINVPNIGSTITIPLLNAFGFIHSTRDAVQSKDVNRSFPGNANGSMASRMAHLINRSILPLIDVGIDLHTGGASRYNYPQIRAELNRWNNLELAMAFAAPFSIQAPLRPGSLRQAAKQLKKSILVYEGGESQRFDETSISEGYQGIHRFLSHLGMANKPPIQQKNLHILKSMSWIRSPMSGLFQSFVEAGQWIHKKQTLGVVTDIHGMTRQLIVAKKEGFIVGLNCNPVVHLGDALVNLGTEE
jgi:predicted deacylase